MDKFLKDLNEAQQQAVLQADGPMMVIAGAGSGKTRVLTYKVAWLISKGIDPFHILALTFTNKAAREMKERIVQLVGADARNLWMGTFHAIFARILRIEGHRIGYPSNFTIYDTDDSKNLIKTIVKEQSLDPKVYQPNNVLGRISACKTNLITAQEYVENTNLTTQDKLAARPEMGKLYLLYQQRCFKASAMDFDDLLTNTYIILRDFPDALYKYQQKFKYILVDEYQDTNHVQYQIIKSLAANNENICVVGDDAQSIYGFRGANIQNIFSFKFDYPDHKLFKLEQNYRSTQTIVKAANSIIVNNKDQIFKEIWTDNEIGNRIRVLRAPSDNAEGNLVAASIFENKMNFQLPNKAFTILYRTNSQSRAMEEALRKLNIPYRIYGGLSFYKRKEIKDLLAYFRLAINHNDEEALVRIINYPARGIGKTSLEKLTVAVGNGGNSIWEVINDSNMLHGLVNSGTMLKINEFATMIKSFTVMHGSKDAYELGRHIAVSSGILRDLDEDKTPEGVNRVDNIQELLNAMREFCEKQPDLPQENGNGGSTFRTLTDFMLEIALLTDADTEDDDNNKVSLMTVHQAKGLEFPYVFVVGLEENLFPSFQSLASRADLEEERRLFYVAVTRAQQRLYLSYAENRYRWGDLMMCEPSRFIEEIDPKYLEMPSTAKFSRFQPHSPKFVPDDAARIPVSLPHLINFKPIQESARKAVADDPGFASQGDLQTGMEVEHDRFGRGKVISLEGIGPNCKATVFFKSVGQKQLLVKFAKLKIIG
ncbi:MAG: 3'-5' exonuclease [Bacteroidales bacterium]|nr:3'-5' exonuclease [Bacteroidales bacterium]MDZ4205285.1 3'-5' exonuclease [Bacteroidales bacterium]